MKRIALLLIIPALALSACSSGSSSSSSSSPSGAPTESAAKLDVAQACTKLQEVYTQKLSGGMESDSSSWESYVSGISSVSEQSSTEAVLMLQPVLMGASGYAAALKVNGEDLQRTKEDYISRGAAVAEQTCKTAGVTIKLS